jgi:hypothetical protein
MKVQLVFVPPDGGEADYSLHFELPSVPHPGDYISVKRPGEDGTADFIVRRSWWSLDYPDADLSGKGRQPKSGRVVGVAVECEFALGGYSSEGHKRSCEMYRQRGRKVRKFEASTY